MDVAGCMARWQVEKDEKGAIIPQHSAYAAGLHLEGRTQEEPPIALELKKAVVVAKTTRSVRVRGREVGWAAVRSRWSE